MTEQLVDYEVYQNEFETKKAESAALQLANGGDQAEERPATTLEEAIERGLLTYTITRPNGITYTLSVQKVLNDRRRRNHNQRNRMWTRYDPRDHHYPGEEQRYRAPPLPQERSHWHQVADQYKESYERTQKELIASRKEVQELRDQVTKLEKSVEYHQRQSDNWHRTNTANCDYMEQLKKENRELKNKNGTMQAETSSLKYEMEHFKKAIDRFLTEEE